MSNTNTLEPAVPRADSQLSDSQLSGSQLSGSQLSDHQLPRTRAIRAAETAPELPATRQESAPSEQSAQHRPEQSAQHRPEEPDQPDQQGVETWAYVDAAQNGDSAAFGRLYDQYAHVVYRYVLFRVSDHCLAEDITSETFLRALRRIASVSYQGRDVAAWFITIAKNLVLDHIKSSRNRLEVPSYELVHGSPTAGAQQRGPEHHVLAAATQVELQRCVRALNPDQRECIRLRFGHGLSVTETAELMQRNEGAIKALQHRAIRRLGQLLPDDPR